MIYYFAIHCVLLVALFVWLDRRQMERYNLFARWSQVFSKMLGEDMQQIRDDVSSIKESKQQQ